jgi:hypothetical protein
MTTSQRSRTIEARNQTMILLDRELAYLPQHQNADRVAFYRAHIAKLNAMLGE